MTISISSVILLAFQCLWLGPLERWTVTPDHALYLAVVQIDHPKEEEEASVLIKVFADDLQSVIRASYEQDYQMGGEEVFCQRNAGLLDRYFKKNLVCRINGGSTILQFKEGILEGEVYWLRFSLSAPSSWNSIQIKAPFFTEIFSSQSNIIHLQEGAEKRFARLNKIKVKATFIF